jgi:hypothetical protein
MHICIDIYIHRLIHNFTCTNVLRVRWYFLYPYIRVDLSPPRINGYLPPRIPRSILRLLYISGSYHSRRSPMCPSRRGQGFTGQGGRNIAYSDHKWCWQWTTNTTATPLLCSRSYSPGRFRIRNACTKCLKCNIKTISREIRCS